MSYEAPKNGFRTFVIVWVTQSISVFGSALTGFAMNIWLTQTLYPRLDQRSELGAALAMVGLAGALPVILGAPIAGAWADRYDRKRTMMVMDFISAGLSILLAALVFTGVLQLWMLIGIIFLMAISAAFHGAAFDTSYAMLVSEEQLPRANGMMQTIWALSGILSPGVAAAIIGVPAMMRNGILPGGAESLLAKLSDGTALAMGIDAVTFFFAAVTLIFLTIPSPKHETTGSETKERGSFWSDVGFGWVYIWRRRPLLWLLGTFALANFTAAPLMVLSPVFVKFNLAADWQRLGFTYESALAALQMLAGIGGVVGGIFITAWGGLKKRRVYGVVVPILLAALAQIVYGATSWFYVALVANLLLDFFLPVLNAHSQTIWQTQTPRPLQGRVFAVRRLIAQISGPIATSLVGGITGLGLLYDPTMLIWMGGILMAAFCVFQLFNPALLKVEDREWLESLAAQAEA